MPSAKKKSSAEGYSRREIYAALNNALIATCRASSGPIPQARWKKLRPVVLALIEPFREIMAEEQITYQEVCAVLVAGALAIHLTKGFTVLSPTVEGALAYEDEENPDARK